MLQNPGDLDIAFEYAEISTQVGDYEGAVSTLERMLIFAPNTPRLQLELGILYYRLGSYEIARSYFAQVVANPNVLPGIGAKVQLYLQRSRTTAYPPPPAPSTDGGTGNPRANRSVSANSNSDGNGEVSTKSSAPSSDYLMAMRRRLSRGNGALGMERMGPPIARTPS
jgi:tetratricopeptide (TPR) repeat protein